MPIAYVLRCQALLLSQRQHWAFAERTQAHTSGLRSMRKLYLRSIVKQMDGSPDKVAMFVCIGGLERCLFLFPLKLPVRVENQRSFPLKRRKVLCLAD